MSNNNKKNFYKVLKFLKYLKVNGVDCGTFRVLDLALGSQKNVGGEQS